MALGTGRVLLSEYLQARGAAFEARQFMDAMVRDRLAGADVDTRVLLWLAFMAGSDWERKYRGTRYAHETTGSTPYLDLDA